MCIFQSIESRKITLSPTDRLLRFQKDFKEAKKICIFHSMEAV